MRFANVILLSGVLAAGHSRIAFAQTGRGTPLLIGHSERVDSRILGETRVVDVTLPGGYESNPSDRYPVIVVLDGEVEHEIAAATARFYATMSQLPATIVVGVRNTDRMRDMTPKPEAGFRAPREGASAGGAERFLAFLAEELVPHLDRTYRTAPLRVLVGHSLSGLFALYALARQPDLFTGYVVMEPAIWWNNQRELQMARGVLRQPAARRARVMLVNAPGMGVDTTQWGGNRPMVRHLRTTGETHASMALSGMMQGLRTMFADFRPPEWRPGTRPVATLEHYDSLAERVGYAVPIPASAFEQAVRMSAHSRFFDDAERALSQMERTLGVSVESRQLRELLDEERATPQSPNFIPLEVPVRRPTPQAARAFLGRWITMDEDAGHHVEVRASGDTIVVHDRILLGSGEWFEADDPVIQVTADGMLEWGLPFFRGIAALVVLRGRVQEDGTMTVTREVRGWVPRGPAGPDLNRIQRFRRGT